MYHLKFSTVFYSDTPVVLLLVLKAALPVDLTGLLYLF